MSDEKCPHMWFPANPTKQKQMEMLYRGALRYMTASPNGAVSLVDLYTIILMVNRQDPLPVYSAQLAFECAYADAKKAIDEGKVQL